MSEHVSFPCFIICHFFIPVYFQMLSRTTHLPIFSCLAGAQFADYVTCLATNHFALVCADNCLSAGSLFYTHTHTHTYTHTHTHTHTHTFFSLNMSENVFVSELHPFAFSSSQAQQSHPPTHFWSLDQRTIYLLHYLTRLHTFYSGLHRLLPFLHCPYYMFLRLDMSVHVLSPCFTHLLSFHPSELP